MLTSLYNALFSNAIISVDSCCITTACDFARRYIKSANCKEVTKSTYIVTLSNPSAPLALWRPLSKVTGKHKTNEESKADRDGETLVELYTGFCYSRWYEISTRLLRSVSHVRGGWAGHVSNNIRRHSLALSLHIYLDTLEARRAVPQKCESLTPVYSSVTKIERCSSGETIHRAYAISRKPQKRDSG